MFVINNCGGLAEWSMAADLKSVERRRSVGSNPTSSAILFEPLVQGLEPQTFDLKTPVRVRYGLPFFRDISSVGRASDF